MLWRYTAVEKNVYNNLKKLFLEYDSILIDCLRRLQFILFKVPFFGIFVLWNVFFWIDVCKEIFFGYQELQDWGFEIQYCELIVKIYRFSRKRSWNIIVMAKFRKWTYWLTV